MVLVSIVIPTKNRLELLKDCLFNITMFTDDVDYEIILSDNDSEVPVLDFYKSLGTKYKVVFCPGRFNFAQLCNEGAKLASGKFILFLNNDTKPMKGWLSEMLKLYEEKEFIGRVGTIGSKLLFPDGRIQHIGQIFRYSDKVPTHLFYGADPKDPKIAAMADIVRKVTGNTAACMLVRTDRFIEVAGFDVNYQNGFEDIDFNCKLTEKGYDHYYCPTSVIYHIEHGTLNPDSERDKKNLTYFFNKWGKNMRRVEKG